MSDRAHHHADERARLRREMFLAAEVEERLRRDLDDERARAVALEREIEALRSSEAFRVGHVLVKGLNRRFRRRPSAMLRGLRRTLTGGAAKPQPSRSDGDADQAAPQPNTVLFVAWGAGESRLATYAEQVERLRTTLVEFHPVFVVDSQAADSIRRRGYPMEYVIPREEWAQHRSPHEWGAYVTERIAMLSAKHSPRTVVVLDADGAPSALDQGLINAIVLPRIGESDSNLLEDD